MSIERYFRSLQIRMKESSTMKYKVFLCATFVFFFVFGTSKLWLPSDAKVMNTPIGTQLSTSTNTSLKLRSWEYSKLNQYMEITFDVQNNEDIQNLNFVPTAHTNIEKNKDMNASTALSVDGTLIVQIKDVPQKWDAISLFLQDNLSPSDNMQLSNGAKFYCDIRKVTINNSLKPKTELAYQIESVENDISDTEYDIENFEKQIQQENADIDQLNFDITALKENQKYQTDAEISKSNSVIASKLSEIDNHKNTILELQKEIEESKIKLQKLNQKLADTKSGKLSVLEAPSPTASTTSQTNGSQEESVD